MLDNGSYFNISTSFVGLDEVIKPGEIGVCGDEAFPDKRRELVL